MTDDTTTRPTTTTTVVLLVFSWVMVLVPIGYGLWQTLMKAMLLFGSG